MLSSDLMLALRSRWRLILMVFLIVMGLSVAWLMTTERVYVARASLLFDDRGPDPALQNSQPSQDLRALLGTQADLIRSEVVARRVIKSENLTQNPKLRAEWVDAGSPGQFENWLATALLEKIEVAPEKDTNVLAVVARADDPNFAARLANGFASSFVAARMEISTNTAKQYARWFAQQTNEVRGNLERAQATVTEFQRAHGMAGNNSLALEADRLSALSNQLAEAEGVAADMRSRAGNQASQSPDVQTSEVIASLRRQLAESEAKVSQLASSRGDLHPEMIAAKAERDTLASKLRSETASATQTVRVASSAASSRESQLRDLVATQRGRMLAVTANQGELEALQNQVSTAQKAYDAVTQRLNLMRLQSGLPTTNAQQVDRAIPPLLPASPNVPLMLLLAAIAGVSLGVIATIVAEIRRPLVRTVRGLANYTELPVLGSFDFGALPRQPVLKLGGA